MAWALPKRVPAFPLGLYSDRLNLTLEPPSGQYYDVSVAYRDGCPGFPGLGSNDHYPEFVEVMKRENSDVLLDRSRKVVLLQWLDFEDSLVQDIVDLMEYAEREEILGYDMIIDAIWSGVGSGGAYAIQRLVDQPFRTTFGNVGLSDLGREKILGYLARRRVRDDAPDMFGLNMGRSWLVDWAQTDATEAIERADEYTPPVPFKLAQLPKDSDGILQPAPYTLLVKLPSSIAIINGRTSGGSHADQFVAMFVNNDLAVFLGTPTGGFSNTYDEYELSIFRGQTDP